MRALYVVLRVTGLLVIVVFVAMFLRGKRQEAAQAERLKQQQKEAEFRELAETTTVELDRVVLASLAVEATQLPTLVASEQQALQKAFNDLPEGSQGRITLARYLPGFQAYLKALTPKADELAKRAASSTMDADTATALLDEIAKFREAVLLPRRELGRLKK